MSSEVDRAEGLSGKKNTYSSPQHQDCCPDSASSCQDSALNDQPKLTITSHKDTHGTSFVRYPYLPKTSTDPEPGTPPVLNPYTPYMKRSRSQEFSPPLRSAYFTSNKKSNVSVFGDTTVSKSLLDHWPELPLGNPGSPLSSKTFVETSPADTEPRCAEAGEPGTRREKVDETNTVRPATTIETDVEGRQNLMSGASGVGDSSAAAHYEDECVKEVESWLDVVEQLPFKVLNKEKVMDSKLVQMQFRRSWDELPDRFLITGLGLSEAAHEIENQKEILDANKIHALEKRGGTCFDEVVYPENIQPLLDENDPDFCWQYWAELSSQGVVWDASEVNTSNKGSTAFRTCL